MEKPLLSSEVGFFNGTPVLKVLLPEKWILRCCLYGNGNKLSYCTGPGIENCFYLNDIFAGNFSSIWKRCDQSILK